FMTVRRDVFAVVGRRAGVGDRLVRRVVAPHAAGLGRRVSLHRRGRAEEVAVGALLVVAAVRRRGRVLRLRRRRQQGEGGQGQGEGEVSHGGLLGARVFLLTTSQMWCRSWGRLSSLPLLLVGNALRGVPGAQGLRETVSSLKCSPRRNATEGVPYRGR